MLDFDLSISSFPLIVYLVFLVIYYFSLNQPISMFLLKAIKTILFAVVVLFLIFQVRFMPSYEDSLHYRGYDVTINRENSNFNIPSINGQSKLAALYGFGYATAEDRLFQIHMKRMIGKGRLAEMVGEKGIGLDIFFRELGVGHSAKITASKMKMEDPSSYEVYQAYADGINDYVKNSGLGLQFYIMWIGFEEWQVQDIFVISKLVDWVQSADGGLTVARELLAEKVGRQKAEMMLGSKAQHFLLVNESMIVSDEQLRWSNQFKSKQEEQPSAIVQNQPSNQGVQTSTQQSNIEDEEDNISEAGRIDREPHSSPLQREIQKQAQHQNAPQTQPTTSGQEGVEHSSESQQSQAHFTQQQHKPHSTQETLEDHSKQQPPTQPAQEQGDRTGDSQDNPEDAEEIDPQLLHLIDGGAGASNSWVISGKYTASGRPILANDPHLATSIPSEWFQAEIRYPHEGREAIVKGAFIAGSAISASIGKTGYFAWGCTTQYKDTQDLYREKVEGDRYLVDGEWRALTQRQERIRVRNGDDKMITVSETHRGPLITKIVFLQKLLSVPGNVSLAWTGVNTNYQFLSTMIKIAEPNSYEQAMSNFRSLDHGPGMNVVYITKDDHFGYQTLGRIPKRKGKQSAFFFDGTTTRNDWNGFITGEDKLHLHDPPKGFIVTANSRPASSNFKWGYHAVNFQVTARQNRITKLLRQKIDQGRKLTVKDSIEIQLDEVDEYCLVVLPYLKQIDPRFSTLFSNWQCKFSATSQEASIYETFLLKLQFKLHPHRDLHIYGLLQFNHYTFKYIIQSATNFNPADIAVVTQSLSQALEMEKKEWGQLHLTHYPHLPFSNTPFKHIFDRYHPAGGNLNTPKMGKMVKLFEQNFNCQHHATLRMVLTFQEDKSKWVIDTGTSSYPFSNHYDDQELFHKQGRYASFDREDKDGRDSQL